MGHGPPHWPPRQGRLSQQSAPVEHCSSRAAHAEDRQAVEVALKLFARKPGSVHVQVRPSGLLPVVLFPHSMQPALSL